MLFIAIGASLN